MTQCERLKENEPASGTAPFSERAPLLVTRATIDRAHNRPQLPNSWHDVRCWRTALHRLIKAADKAGPSNSSVGVLQVLDRRVKHSTAGTRLGRHKLAGDRRPPALIAPLGPIRRASLRIRFGGNAASG